MKSEVEFPCLEGENPDMRVMPKWIAVDIFDKGQESKEIVTVTGEKKTFIISMGDDMKERGIRPRQARVLAIGKDALKGENVKVGDVVLIEHLGWTHKIGYYMTPEGKKQDFWMTQIDKIEMVIER